MQPLTHQIKGYHLVREDAHDESHAHALLLDEDGPEQTIRLAFIVQGSERHVFPALALDDWGRERQGLRLYRWIYEEGTRFPRAELFGFTVEGDQMQIFLRDLELSYRYPCYIYGAADEPVQNGRLLSAIFTTADHHEGDPLKIEPPTGLPWALRRAAVRWRRVDPRALAGAGWQPLSPP